MNVIRNFVLGLLLIASTTTMAQFTVAQSYGPVTIASGADNYLPSAAGKAIGSAASQMLIRNQQVSWPLTGGDGISFEAEYSTDGVTWIFIGGDGIDDVQQGGFRGVPVGETRWGVSIPEVGVNRFVRLHYHFYKQLRVSGAIEVQ